jgi:hypothetical protein
MEFAFPWRVCEGFMCRRVYRHHRLDRERAANGIQQRPQCDFLCCPQRRHIGDVKKVLRVCRFSVPPGYRREQPAAKPKLGPLVPVIDAILEADRDAPVKQRHTAKRIFERLRDEHGYTGGYTVVVTAHPPRA